MYRNILDLNLDELNEVLRENDKKESEYNRGYLKRIIRDFRDGGKTEFIEFMKSHHHWQFML